MKGARKFLIEDPLNLVKEKIKADKIDKASFEKIEKIIFDLIKTSAIAEQYLSASEEAHIHLQSSICHWIESLMERKFHCVCFFQSKTASLNTKNPVLEKDQFLNWFNSDGNPLTLQ